MKTAKVNRFEIIDHTLCLYCKAKDPDCEECGGLGCPGRKVMMIDKNKQINIELQDDEQTLKVFIHDRYEA